MLSRTSTTLLDGLRDPANDAAWRRFYARYTPMLHSYARRVGLSDADAQDAVADALCTFVRAYRDGRYDRTRARLKSWLGGIAHYKIRRLRERRAGVTLDPNLPDLSEPDPDFDREWQLERLNEALEMLRGEIEPDTYQAFDLYALKDWPAEKVACFLGVSTNVVYIAKTRVLKRLREIVGELVNNEE